MQAFSEHEARRGRIAVSVILPTFNCSQFVSRAIDSVLRQQGDHWLELIVADDCSSDDTVAHIRDGFGSDGRLRFSLAERNAGPGAARNRGIAAATGDWIALIDADDAWAENRLSALSSLCAQGADLIFDNIIGYDQASEASSGLLFPFLPEEMSVPAMAEDPAPGSKFNYGYLKPLIRRGFLEETKVRYPEVRVSEDLLFYLELLIKGARTSTTDQAFYVYTTKIGQRSKRRSTFSVTAPDSELVARLLDQLAAKYRSELREDELEAIESRAQRLRRLASANELYHHWFDGDYLAVARQCLTDAAARRHVMRTLADRLRRA